MMDLFGENLSVVGMDLDIPIEKVGTWAFDTKSTVSLYDSDSIVVFMNLPDQVYKNYNAWAQLPGEWAWYSKMRIRPSVVKEKALKLPELLGKSIEGKYSEIFACVRKLFGALEDARKARAFDWVYSAARINNMTVKAFLNETAERW